MSNGRSGIVVVAFAAIVLVCVSLVKVDGTNDLVDTLETAGFTDVSADLSLSGDPNTAVASVGTCSFNIEFIGTSQDEYRVYMDNGSPSLSIRNATADQLKTDQNVVPASVRELCFGSS